MMLQEFIEANEFKITGGSDFGWNCFGANARYIDCDQEDTFSISALFDSQTQEVYVIEAWDYANNREYRWIDPRYKSEYDREAQEKEIDPNESLDGKRYIDLELVDDILEKIKGIRSGEDYDTRVQVPLNLPDDSLFELMKLAHEADLTLNEYVEQILRTAIDFEVIRSMPHFTNTDNPVDFPVTKKKKKGKK